MQVLSEVALSAARIVLLFGIQQLTIVCSPLPSKYFAMSEFHRLCSLPDVIRMIKIRRIEWAGLVAFAGEKCTLIFGTTACRKEATAKI
jgi:hypothetical protein